MYQPPRRHLSLGLHSLSDRERHLQRLEDLLDRLADRHREARGGGAAYSLSRPRLVMGIDCGYDDLDPGSDGPDDLLRSESPMPNAEET